MRGMALLDRRYDQPERLRYGLNGAGFESRQGQDFDLLQNIHGPTWPPIQ